MPNFLKPLRFISFLEGCSYLYLLFASLVQKRMWGIEEAIQIPGMIHGVLFVIFALLLLLVWIKQKWKTLKPITLFLYSLLPFGFILIDLDLKNEPKKSKAAPEH